jgi:pimeloyl-ACP methyl ester carboxylesterase
MSPLLDGFRHQVFDAEGVKIHAVIGGAGPPLVLVHGFPQTWWAWHKVMPLLAERHTVVAVDLRGAGDSDAPASGYDKATMALDIHQVMATLGFRSYAVCGHDIGAMVATALAFTHRDAVTQLIVMDTALPGWSGWDQLVLDPRLWHYAFHMKRDLPERLLIGREYDYVATFLHDRAWDHSSHSETDLLVFAEAFARPGRTRAGLEWYRAFPGDNLAGIAWKRNKLTIPTLALGGEHRFGSRIVGVAQEFSAKVSGGSVAGCGHWLAEERPTETSEVVLRFLKDNPHAA